MLNNISTIEQKYTLIEKFNFSDITYHRSILSVDGEIKLGSTVRIAFNRPIVSMHSDLKQLTNYL